MTHMHMQWHVQKSFDMHSMAQNDLSCSQIYLHPDAQVFDCLLSISQGTCEAGRHAMHFDHSAEAVDC